MSADLRITRAFRRGWLDGAAGTACMTAREVAASYPDYDDGQTDAYLNGAADGAARDTFRLNA